MPLTASFAQAIFAELCAIGLILGCWVSLFVVLSGLGSALRIPFNLKEADVDDVFLCFWLGFSVLLVFLQLWHLFQPVNTAAACILALSGGVGHLATRGAIFQALRREFGGVPKRFVGGLLLVAVWVANHATAAPDSFDSGNYHFQVIRWVTSYPIVKGVGNVDGHLAFNNASLLYQGLLETGFLLHRSSHIGNGILLLVVLLFLVFKIREAFLARKFTPQALFALVLLTTTVFLTPDVATPNTDLPVTLTLFVIAYYLIAFASTEEPRISTEALAFRVVAIAALCSQSSAIKLSAAFYASCACIAFLCLWATTGRAAIQYRARIAAAAVAVVVGSLALWAGRSVWLTGYPFFPSLALKFPVAWRIPEFYAEWYGWWIRTFARVPYREDVSMDGFAWIPNWFSDLRGPKMQGDLPLLLAALAFTYFAIRFSQKRLQIPSPQVLLVWLPIILAIPLWFASAPSFRFGSALIWILAAQAIALALHHALKDSPRLGGVAVRLLCLMPLSGILMQTWLSYKYDHRLLASLETTLWVAPGPDHGLHPTYVNAMERVVNAEGVTLYHPANQFCSLEQWRDCVTWYGALPGTLWHGPHAGATIKEHLTYLSPPDPSGGFAIHDTREQWLARHADDVRRMARDAHMNLRQLTFYFSVGPDVIRAALRAGSALSDSHPAQSPDARGTP